MKEEKEISKNDLEKVIGATGIKKTEDNPDHSIEISFKPEEKTSSIPYHYTNPNFLY